MNIATFQRFGLKRTRPLESDATYLRIGATGSGSLRLQWLDGKQHELVLVVNDQGTLERIKRQIERTLSGMATSPDLIESEES